MTRHGYMNGKQGNERKHARKNENSEVNEDGHER